MISEGWQPVDNFPSLYSKEVNGEHLLLGVYVDDFYMMAPEEEGYEELVKLQKHFQISSECMDEFRFLGINRIVSNDSAADHMIPYIDVLLAEYKKCLNLNGPLREYSVPFSRESANTPDANVESELLKDNPKYEPQSFIASLLFLCRCARPDLSFAVSYMGRAVNRWTKMHDRCLRQTMGYLQATRDLVLKIPNLDTFVDGYTRVLTYSDADLAGCLNTGKSTSGFCTFLADLHGNKMLIDWGSKLQVGVALSTADAEMAAVQRATCRSSLPAQILMEETLGFECPITHFADNQPCITAIKNGASQTLRYLCKTQRISIPFLHQIFNENNNLDFVETHHNVSDIMTKILPANKHWQYVYELGLCSLSDFRNSA